LFLSSFSAPAAESQKRVNSPTEPSFACGNQLLTTDDVLAGRYPDAELLNVPDICKQRAKELIAKWRQDDLANWQVLAAEACSGRTSAYAAWLLEQGTVRAEREKQMLDLGCDCYGTLLSQATNAPSAPRNLVIASEAGLNTQHLSEKSGQLPVRFSPEVAVKRANVGLAHNAEEIVKLLAGKSTVGAGLKAFDLEVSGDWNREYKKALQARMLEAHRIQTLSIELGQTGHPSSQLITKDLPATRQKMQDQVRLLSTAYDGIVQSRELPHGQCYEVFTIRHQVMLDFVKQLTAPTQSSR
jgi:hypothetical protein